LIHAIRGVEVEISKTLREEDRWEAWRPGVAPPGHPFGMDTHLLFKVDTKQPTFSDVAIYIVFVYV
jgi:hypothetical protein